MSDLEEGEIEDGELPSTEPQASQPQAASLSSSLEHDGHRSERSSDGIAARQKTSQSIKTSSVGKQPLRLPNAPTPVPSHQQSHPHHKEGSPEAGEVIEDGEIAQQPAVPASAAHNADRAPAAARRKAAARAAPAPKPPLQFRMPDLQKGKAQQDPDLQHTPHPAFTNATSPEQDTKSASSAPVSSAGLAPSATPETVKPLPQPRLDHPERDSQHSLPASESSGAHHAGQQSRERHDQGSSHERVQRDARAHRGMAERSSQGAAPSRSRGAADHRQRTGSTRTRSSMEREPSSQAPEQPKTSAAQRAQREMAPMVSDIEKLLSSISLLTIRKDLEAATSTLKQALEQAYGLYKLCRQKDKGSGVVIRAIFGQVSPKLLASINALYVYACTGQGKAAMKDHATARTCIRLAARDKDYLFTTGDSAKFSNMSTMSEVFRGCDKTQAAQQDANQLSGSAGQPVPPQQHPSQGQAVQQEQSMPEGPTPGVSSQPLPRPTPIHNAPPLPLHGTGPPSLPDPMQLLGGAMPPHLMMQQRTQDVQGSQATSHMQHMHGRPSMSGSQQHPMHSMPGQNGYDGHMGHQLLDGQNAHMHAGKRQRAEPGEGQPHMRHPPGGPPELPPHMQLQRRDPPGPPLPPHVQLPPHDLPQHAHARRAGPPQLPPHLQLHASLQHPLYSSGEAAGHGGAQQLVPGHPPLPPHLAASKSRQQQQQQHAQVPHGIQQQHPLKSAAAPDQQHHRLQLGRSSAAPQPNGKKRVSRRHRAREFRQREQQLLNGGDRAEQMNIEQWPQHDSAAAPHSVPGLLEEQQPHLLPIPPSQKTDPGQPTPMEIEELSDSEGLYGDAGWSTGGSKPHAAAAQRDDTAGDASAASMDMQPQPDAAAERELALGEAPHRTERVTKAPSMSEEDYVEAGAKELQQLYADMAPDMCRLLSQQRLVLVLDLDHTLVNSARQTEIDPEHVLLLEEKLQEEADWPELERSLFKLDTIGMWTKLRPGVRAMLAQLAPLFQMWIFTNGTRPYAEAIADLLDPQGGLFHRVIANSASTDKDGMPVDQLKSFSRGLAAMDAAVVVVDDNDHVWQNHRHNLLRVERYMYFPIAMRHFGRSDKSLLERGKDESPQEGMLKHTLDALLRTHITAFEALWEQPERLPNSLWKWDVRHSMWVERQKVLAGVTILFSALVPLGQDPRAHNLGQLAEQYGAMCVTQEDESVSHVVAANSGSAKAQWALTTGKHLVSRHWLESSCTLWKRAQESRFPAPAATQSKA